MAILPFMSSGRVLALYDDGVMLWGGVVVRRGAGVELKAVARAPMPDPQAALQKVLATLCENGSVPRRVHIAVDRAVLTRVEFPIAPDRPRAYTEMRELARWEAEPTFSDLPCYGVGEVLTGLGRMGPTDLAAVEDTIASRPLAPGAPPPRPLDVAVEMGLIDRATREAAMELVERLGMPPQETGCAWAPIAVDEDSHPEGAPYPWLISAVPETARAQWRMLCKRAGLALESMVPAWGLGMAAAAPVLADTPADGRLMLIERHANAIFSLRFGHDDVDHLELTDLSRIGEVAALERLLQGGAEERTLAYGFEGDAAAFISSQRPGAVAAPAWPRVALEALGAIALDLADDEGPPQVAPAEPGPPLHRKPIVHRVALIGALLFGLGGYEGYNQWRLLQAENRLDALEAEYDSKVSIAKQIRSNIARAEALAKDADAREAEVALLANQVLRMRYLQERRGDLAIRFLNAIRSAAHSRLVLVGIEEVDALPEVFVVSAWSVDETGAERFISVLNAELAALGLGVADETIRLERGIRGYDGYAIRLRVAPQETWSEEDEGVMGFVMAIRRALEK
ncbi:MAG: hypothetical protein AAF577_16185 [Pseudomonadota bacterium]